jgi:uncharacterized membrane protein
MAAPTKPFNPMIFGLQALLALAYTLLAHVASARHDDRIAAVALALLALMLLLAPMARRRAWAWLALPLLWAGVLALYRNGLVEVPMLLVPVAFVALVAWWFGRSLRAGRVPLISRIVAALDKVDAAALAPELRSYTRNLTAAWAWLLAVLALVNLVLALVAVPDGLLARLGWHGPLAISQEQWSWFANVSNYGIVGGFFAGEYLYRKRRFPGRYDSFAGFLRHLAALGPAFWRDFLR